MFGEVICVPTNLSWNNERVSDSLHVFLPYKIFDNLMSYCFKEEQKFVLT